MVGRLVHFNGKDIMNVLFIFQELDSSIFLFWNCLDSCDCDCPCPGAATPAGHVAAAGGQHTCLSGGQSGRSFHPQPDGGGSA